MGLLDDHNPYPSIPPRIDTAPRPGAAAVVALVFSILWLFGLGSIVGTAAGVYARIQAEPGTSPRTVGGVAIALGVIGLVGAVWVAANL